MKFLTFVAIWLIGGSCYALTIPYVQILAGQSGLADACFPSSIPSVALVNVNVPAGASYRFSTYFYVAYAPGGVNDEDAPFIPEDEIFQGFLYASPIQGGPLVNPMYPFSMATSATWYNFILASLPDHTAIIVRITTYASADGSGPPASTATIAWDCTSGQVLSIRNEGNAAGAAEDVPKTAAVEYYHAGLNHYFVTASSAEMAALDSGRTVGWVRTGQTFNTWLRSAPGLTPVCRLYIPPELGNSHFYSASPDECTEIRRRFPSFVHEAPDVFYVALPDLITGVCPLGTVGVYRLWNKRVDSNHRYTRDAGIKAQMVAQGFVAEGYGADAVAMCAPQ